MKGAPGMAQGLVVVPRDVFARPSPSRYHAPEMTEQTGDRARRRIAIVSTGGTIEKTYDELAGVLRNELSVLEVMLGQLELGGIDLERVALMNKDSLDMTPEDHDLIARTVVHKAAEVDGVVVVHGTDLLAVTGERIYEMSPRPPVPIILTGAMRPYVMRTTDAMQNLTESLMAIQLAPPGVYAVMHNKLLAFPGVEKDAERGTFVGPSAR